MLLHEQEVKSSRTVVYWFRILSEEKQKLGTTHRECLVFIWAVALLRHYLKENRSTIQTDREAVWTILFTAEVTGRLARWRLQLSESDFEIVHRVGITHQIADALPRLKTKDENKTQLDDEFPILTVPQASFAYVLQMDTTNFGFTEEPKYQF